MKVIFIAQHIIPMPTPRAHRAFELANEFSRNGHEVTIYAVLGKYDYTQIENKFNLKIKNIPIHFQLHPYNSDNDGKRLFMDKVFGKILGKIVEFPNIEFLFRINNLVRNELDADLFITIADPHHIHWGMSRAKRKLGDAYRAMWIADCGDPFMANGKTKYHLNYFAKFEHYFCKQADFITVPIENAKDQYFQEYRSKMHVIPQGFSFDLNELKKEIPKFTTNKPIKFAYAGLLHANYRNPQKFLGLLSSLDWDFEFHIFSPHHVLTKPFQETLGEKLCLQPSLPRDQLMKKLKQYDFVVNLENENLPGQMPSKLIDYSILRKPILNLIPNQLNKRLIYEFLNGNFSNSLVVVNPEQYHITSVYNRFISLVDQQL